MAKRLRPRISVTLDPAVYGQLRRVQGSLPGANLSGVVNEALAVSLPLFEEMSKAMRSAVKEDGDLDDQRVRDELAKWAGAQLLGLSDTSGMEAVKE